jgi:hypothetical protein
MHIRKGTKTNVLRLYDILSNTELYIYIHTHTHIYISCHKRVHSLYAIHMYKNTSGLTKRLKDSAAAIAEHVRRLKVKSFEACLTQEIHTERCSGYL